MSRTPGYRIAAREYTPVKGRDHDAISPHERMFLSDCALEDEQKRKAARYVETVALDVADRDELLAMLGLDLPLEAA